MRLCLDMRTGAGCGTENPNYARECSTCRKDLRFALTLKDPKTLVGHYRIVQVIGYGAYGAVYEALPAMGRGGEGAREQVALKETFDASSISTFAREFSVLSGLDHANLPRYLDMFEEQGSGYLVMEYVQGQSLQEILDDETELLPESQVLGYALQLCDVLTYLHSQQPPILHRDIKPANIRLTPEGRIKLVDFGLLKEGGYQTRATIRGLGTPAYAPLEQYGDNQQATNARSDIYSLGATLYHLLSGQEPLSAPNRLAGESDLLSPLPSEVSLNIRQAIMKAISLMPRARFASISHLRQGLLGVESVEVDVVIEKRVPEPYLASTFTPAYSGKTSMESLVQLLPAFLKHSAVRLGFSAILIAIIAMTWFSISDFGMSPESEAITPPPARVVVAEDTKTPQPVVEDTKTPKREESVVGEGSTTGGMACFGSFGFGITCLNESGWRSFSKDNSALGSDLISDMAICPDNRLLIAHTFGISAFDGQNWAEYKAVSNYLSPDGIACDANNGIWVAHYEGVSYFDGKSWSTTPSEQLATGDDATDLLKDVVIAPDGRVWVATAHTIATTLDGSEWTIYQQGQGFNDQYFLDSIAVDSQGGLWVAYSRGLLHFDGTTWQEHENWDFTSIENVAVDQQDNIWFGTFNKGLGIFNGQTWATYDRTNSDLPSDHVRSVAIDAQGRVWAGTDWGLSVFDGLEWQTYQMDSADLVENDIRALAVRGGGPILPEASDKENGSLSGQLLKPNKEPIFDATVELCAPDSYSYFDNFPCEEQPFILQTTTDADGNFVITDIPVGRVVLTVKTVGGKWIEVENQRGFDSGRVLIKAGEETDLSILIIDEEED